MQAGRVPGQCDILVAGPAEHILVFRPAYESGLKPSLATTIAKASERVIADPPAWKTLGRRQGEPRDTSCFPRCGKSGAKASERVIADSPARKTLGRRQGEPRDTSCFPRCGKNGAKASERVIADSPVWEQRGRACKTVHMECAVSPTISKAALIVTSFPVPRPKPGTQCHTSATSLRKQSSKLRESDRPQIRGSAQGRVLPPMRQGRRIGREPRSPRRSLNG